MALRGTRFEDLDRIIKLAAKLPQILKQPVRPTPVAVTRQVQRRLTAMEVDQLVEQYKDGATMDEVARVWGTNRWTVAAHLKRRGVPTQPPRTVHDCIREAAELYEQGWTCQQLGVRYGCSAETARKALIRHGVRTRRPWERG